MFSSPEAALRFAFRMREKSIISSPSGVFMSKDKNKNPNAARLTAYDFHAQAGMIFGRVDRMKEDQQVWVYLNYGNKNERAACAKIMSVMLIGNTEAIKYRLSAVDLNKVLLSTSIRQCARTTGLTNHKSWKIRGSLHGSMEPVMLRTMEELWTWLNSGQEKD
jgi:hypothetical protein